MSFRELALAALMAMVFAATALVTLRAMGSTPHRLPGAAGTALPAGSDPRAATLWASAGSARNRLGGLPGTAGKEGQLPASGAPPASRPRAATLQALDSVALVYIAGREKYLPALREAILQYVPVGAIFRAPGKSPPNFIQALGRVVGSFPNASWYYVVDDDSFVHLDRLASLVPTLDATLKVLVGKHDCRGLTCGNQDVACRRRHMQGTSNPGWACGGPGVLVSRPLARAMVGGRCEEYYAQRPAPVGPADMAFACCAYDVWEGLNITHVPGFSPYPIREEGFKRDKKLIAVHHIDPQTTLRLGRLYNSHLART